MVYVHLVSAIFSKGGLVLEKEFHYYLCKNLAFFTEMLSLAYIHKPPPKLFLSSLNILYPANKIEYLERSYPF